MASVLVSNEVHTTPSRFDCSRLLCRSQLIITGLGASERASGRYEERPVRGWARPGARCRALPGTAGRRTLDTCRHAPAPRSVRRLRTSKHVHCKLHDSTMHKMTNSNVTGAHCPLFAASCINRLRLMLLYAASATKIYKPEAQLSLREQGVSLVLSSHHRTTREFGIFGLFFRKHTWQRTHASLQGLG